MAVSSSLSVLLASPVPKITYSEFKTTDRILNRKSVNVCNRLGCRYSSTRLNAAGFTEIEPDLNEDPIDRWRTPGVDAEDFEYGKWDGHHTYFEGESDEKGTLWEIFVREYEGVGPPTGFQGLISWLFLPAIAAAMYFNAPGEYMFIGAGLFALVFCIIEMDKPDQPHNFEPQIYTMERGARDKLINDYNTMSIWDFNEKYGDLWDFTIKQDDITKR
ncbi:photosynthetic NDH subunit of subcomplex B 5, chloroplastic [Euphorbia lathyris]|uniref:photosynthetic NDH subunit of subcomplex B 5, chloroplastic n=1 Tax=Euphorbia lathyris TaxID=212925 RepID=UPI003313C5B8